MDYLRPDGKTQVTIEYEGNVPKRLRTVLISSQHAPEHRHRRPDAQRPRRARDPPTAARAVRRRRLRGAVQPDRRVRARRPARRLRAHRSQDHRRHVRRHEPSRRRRVQRQGPDQGRPLGRVRGASRGEERGGRGDRAPVRGAGRVRDRRRAPGVDDGRDVRHFGGRSRSSCPTLLKEHFDLRPAAIIERLDLRRPIFQATAAYGHFGRDERDFTWERTDAAPELRKAAEALA